MIYAEDVEQDSVGTFDDPSAEGHCPNLQA